MQTPDTKTALRIYLNCAEIGNAEIRELFAPISAKTISIYKNKVREVMAQRGVEAWNPTSINTKIAYEVWGLDPAELEKKYKRLKALGL